MSPNVFFQLWCTPSWWDCITRGNNPSPCSTKYQKRRERNACFLNSNYVALVFPGGSDWKESACNAGDPHLIPGSGRSPGEGNDSPLQYSCLETPMERVAWRAAVHGVAQSRTRLSDKHTHTMCHWLLRLSQNICIGPQNNFVILILQIGTSGWESY